jgi:hypothetical protein
MNNYNNNHLHDEINLRELILSLWRGKIFLILSVLISISLASYYLNSAERKYTVEYKIKAVVDDQSGSAAGRLGSLASLAGVRVQTGSSNMNFNIYKELLTSNEVAEIIFNNKEIVKRVFRSEWNVLLNKYSRPSPTKFQTLISDFKKMLTGSQKLDYMPPNARRLAQFIATNITIIKNKETGFLTISSETSKPDLLLAIINEANEASDNIMRQRYINFSTEPLAFYKEKLNAARSREHRASLAALIGKEEQKLMLASKGKHFTAEPYLNPTISLEPTSPNAKLVLLLSLVLGLFIGGVIILSFYYVNNTSNSER